MTTPSKPARKPAAPKTVQVTCATASAVEDLRSEVRAMRQASPVAADIVAILGALNGPKSCTIASPSTDGPSYSQQARSGWSVEVTW